MSSCSCKPLNNDVLLEDHEGFFSEQDLLEEEDTESRLENLLGTMKEGFLRKLNMSDVPQEDGRIYPPQFMMELYNKYASNSTAIPQSDVIRSFTVQGLSKEDFELRIYKGATDGIAKTYVTLYIKSVRLDLWMDE